MEKKNLTYLVLIKDQTDYAKQTNSPNKSYAKIPEQQFMPFF